MAQKVIVDKDVVMISLIDLSQIFCGVLSEVQGGERVKRD